MTEGPIRVGAVARQIRVDCGYRSESRFRITACQPDRHLCFEETDGSYRCEYLLEAVRQSSATRITFEFELAKLDFCLLPLQRLIRRFVEEGTNRALDDLRRLPEAQPRPSLNERV